MNLRLDQRVRIDDLLLQREEQFVRVHDCETAIEEILGDAYPFPPPPPLPSQAKRRKPRKAAREAATAQPAGISLPPLEDGEAAYRLHYRASPEGGDSGVTEDYPDPGPLRRWLARPRASVEILRLETIDPRGDTCRVLHHSDAGG